MIPDGYRIVVVYDGERQSFVARVPELALEESAAPSRAEAVAAAEKKIEEAVRKAAEAGEALPRPLDAGQPSGEIRLTVSAGLHRELEFQAREQGVSLEQLCSEILAAAAAGGRPRTRADSAPARERPERPGRGRGPRPASKDYFNVLDDKAAFLEYVRSLEGGKGGGGRRGGRGRE